MNKIITNLPLIADAAEYLDKKTGAAWKIRSCLTNMLVWSANSFLYANKSDDPARQYAAMTQLATLRVWAEDSNVSSFVLDLTSGTVRRTLGLERVVDVHEEACREARTKCIQTRSAANFKKYYDAALAAHAERTKQREEAVESIAFLLSDNGFDISPELADHMRTFEGINPGTTLADKELYDDNTVERQSDTLAECMANALEAMYDVCDHELAAAITTDKVNRLTGYHQGIMQMMSVAGVDTKRLAERRAKLEAQIGNQISLLAQGVADIDAQIAKEVAAMAIPAQVEEAPAPAPKRTRTIKKGVTA